MSKILLLILYLGLLNCSIIKTNIQRSDLSQCLNKCQWKLQRSSEMRELGYELSTINYEDSDWVPAIVPRTVLNSYLHNNSYPDHNCVDNQLLIPNSFFIQIFGIGRSLK